MPSPPLFASLRRIGELLSLAWCRLRYVDPAPACAALTLLAQAGATIELRLRHAGEVVALHVGLGERWASVLEQMAPDFGLSLTEAQEPRPLTGTFAPGARGELPTGDADARLVAPGVMQVRVAGSASPEKRVPRLLHSLTSILHPTAAAGLPAALPAPVLGLHARPELPFDTRCPQGSAWKARAGGFAGPACLIGEESAVRVLALSLAEVALEEDRPTVIIDGTGDLARKLRERPVVRQALASGQLVELSIARAGQRGFNPLAESAQGRDATLARWRWWLRGLGVYEDTIIDAAYDSGIRTVSESARGWSGRGETLAAAHMLQALLAARDVAVWLSGSFDVAQHLRAGGHLLVECPRAQGARLQALRGLLGLAAEGEGRLLSMGVCWSNEDEATLVRLKALCQGHDWERAWCEGASGRVAGVMGRAGERLSAQIAQAFDDLRLGEILVTLPAGVALVRQGSEWWLVRATPG